MKITGVTVNPASYATDDKPPFRRSFAVLRLDTDEGITGWGEASDCYGHRYPLTLKALFEETVQWLLLGRDPQPLEDGSQRPRPVLEAGLEDRKGRRRVDRMERLQPDCRSGDHRIPALVHTGQQAEHGRAGERHVHGHRGHEGPGRDRQRPDQPGQGT